MKKLMAISISAFILAAFCIMPVAAERVEAGGYYEYPAEKTDEIIAGEAGEASVRWSVPFQIIPPTLDGVINPNEYAPFDGLEDYMTLAVSQGYGADKADELYEKVQNGICDAYWCWDDKYLYLAFDVDCVNGYSCSPEQDVLLFAYNCLQVGLADVDAQGKDSSYTELGFGYDAENDRNVAFAWSGTYLPQSDDFVGSYNADTQCVTYELRIDLQKVLGRDRPPDNGDQCNFAFSLEISGDDDITNGAQLMFCHGIAGQYSTKCPEYFARITFEGHPGQIVISPGFPPAGITSNELEYELREMIDFSDTDAFVTMVGEGAALEQVTEGEECFLRITALEDGCYVYSTIYPKNLLSDAKYLVIKYRTDSPKGDQCGLIWRTRQKPDFDVEGAYTAYMTPNGQWSYLLLDMSREHEWNDYIMNWGIVPFFGMENTAGEVIDIAWIKAYNLDPYELYLPLFETTLVSEWETGTREPTTEPPMSELLPDTDWETFVEQEEPERTPNGLFFEVFGEQALLGCQGQPMGQGSGGCHAVTGGLLVICLLAAGVVFRKKE